MSRSGLSPSDFRRARPDEFGLGHTNTPAERKRALVDEVKLATEKLEAALIAQLKAGEIVAYVIPAKLSDPYLIIKPGMWEKNLKLSLRGGTVTGDRFARDRILVLRDGDLHPSLSTSTPGRPEHPLMEEIMTRYWATVPIETDNVSQIERIRHVLQWVASRHPNQKLPSQKTISGWINKEKYRSG